MLVKNSNKPRKYVQSLKACGVIWLACSSLFQPTIASATDITWGAATNIAADTDVSTLGTLIGAMNLGGLATPDATVNGVTFIGVNTTTVDPSVTSGSFTFTGVSFSGADVGSGAAPFSGLTAEYQNLLGPIGGSTISDPLVLTISDLIKGNTYQVQSWYNHSTISFESTLTTGATSVTLNSNILGAGGGIGQYVTGTFLADALTQEIIYTASAAQGLNAFQLRDITPLTAFWKGDVDGNWDTNTLGNTNWSTASDGLTDTGATPGTLTDVTFSGALAGNLNTTLNTDFNIKSLTILDTAEVIIGGLNTLTISGAAGTGVDVQTGAGLFTVDANLTLAGTSDTITVNNTAGAVITGVLTAGVNGLVKQGTGNLTLTGTDTNAGSTTVMAGALVVNGSLSSASTVAVASGATLAGTGSVTAAAGESMNFNGDLSVGDPSLTGLATVASVFAVETSGVGSVVMANGSALQVDIITGAGLGDNTGAPGSSDHLSLTGNLSFAAGSSLVIGNPLGLTGFAGGDKWQLVDLNGGAGAITSFTGAVNDSALALTYTQVGNFDANAGVYQIIDVAGGLQMAAAENQTLINGMQGLLGDINGHLFMLRAGGGEEAEGSISDASDTSIVIGQGDGDSKNPIAKRVLRSRQWEVFTTMNYANINLGSINTQPGVKAYTWAPGVGIERHVSRHVTVGVAVSLLETHQNYSNGLGSLDMEGVAISTYANYSSKNFWVDMLYSFGRFDVDTSRNAAGFPVATSSTAAYTNAVQFNTGWTFRFQDNKLVTGPFLGVDYLNVLVDGYNESGGGIGALNYNSRNLNSLTSRVGWSLSRKFDTDFGVITPQVRLSYERQNLTSNNGTTVNLINQPFSASGNSQHPGQDYMVVGAGVNFQFTPNFSMLLNYQGQVFRQNYDAHYVGLRFGYKF